ncbi:peptidoglycan glycosyltransferase [Desulfotomaculum arcticum]|uniref:Peptidoglycan glycosyltransferase n=1 Tax=Desulfotruncus arcticus DSM 17038 TaxID=1121424 RepID=A0A1I2R8T4_9FIRM|nr:penicillin-binding protein 2 [Desulfotruncus arcticus]SFG36870.1 peptidoglycan glycosyltransferase [Desulfotomaculum arcticum] [Desulfotruncus arcticus DSM 17038]
MKNNVRRLAYVILAGLVAICVYLALIPYYLKHTPGGGALTDPRIAARENMIQRGTIFDREGRVLARSVPQTDGGFVREYSLGSYASHIIGYYSIKAGSAGLEKTRASVLLGLNEGNPFYSLMNRVTGKPGVGNDMILTIDADLQQYVATLLDGQKGAAVVLNPATGEILASASYPRFDPAKVTDYLNQPDSPLLDRALQGAYPPGSIFKIVTAAGILTDLPGMTDETIQCNGELEVNGFILKDNAVHGNVDFKEAFTRSCNVAFGRYGLALGAKDFVKQAGAFGIGVSPDFPLPLYQGYLPRVDELDGPALASSAIGQGKVLVSPLQAALVAGAVANGGEIMKPYLISRYSGPGGFEKTFKPEKWLVPMTPAVAGVLKDEMIAVVQSGTGKAAALPGITVAGKTGSAENPHGQSHAWFVGFAPAEQPRVVVAVVLENQGSGGAKAAPLAGEILRRALEG